MTDDPHIRELITLKTIAETLNQSNDLKLMLDTVLEKILELTDITTGWIFISDGRMRYECVAEKNLPPGLLKNEKEPMRCGSCWCLDKYWDNKLIDAVNILNCKRLENAVDNYWGDTMGITHHATVPLRSGDQTFGLLNVASPGKTLFSDEELALLHAVAFQIGSAIDRMRMYAAERRRAWQFTRLGEFSRTLGVAASTGQDIKPLTEHIVSLIGEHFDWPFAALLEPSVTGDYVLHAVYWSGMTMSLHDTFQLEGLNWLRTVGNDRRFSVATQEEVVKLAAHPKLRRLSVILSNAQAVPVPYVHSAVAGIMIVGDNRYTRQHQEDYEVLEALAEHVAMLMESSKLEANRRELARLEERNRLARDLHDSVSQMLFSLSMMAKGVESLIIKNKQESAITSVRDMQVLSNNALKEMRSLILQLRPAGLEAGLLTSLKAYGERMDLRISTKFIGMRDLSRPVEEALWRIGQEALNNVRKHARTDEAEVELLLNEFEVVFSIKDKGYGITKKSSKRKAISSRSIGLSTMKERAENIGGIFKLSSKYRSGTTIEITIPLPLL